MVGVSATIKPARRARALPMGDEGMAIDIGEIERKGRVHEGQAGHLGNEARPDRSSA